MLHNTIIGNIDILQTLLSKSGIELNEKNNDDHTALMIATIMGHTEMVTILASAAGIKINDKDKDGNTALLHSFIEDHVEIIPHLLAKNADINLQNNDGNTLLHLALMSNNPNHADLVLNLISRQDVNLNIKNNKQKTSLELLTEYKIRDRAYNCV